MRCQHTYKTQSYHRDFVMEDVSMWVLKQYHIKTSQEHMSLHGVFSSSEEK
jgi:hypothetical protein